MTDQTTGPVPAIDTTRQVYVVPVTYLLSTRMYVLATDLEAAREAAATMTDSDLDALLGFTDDTVWVDNEERIDISDLTPNSVEIDQVRLDWTGRAPSDHPDWFTDPIK